VIQQPRATVIGLLLAVAACQPEKTAPPATPVALVILTQPGVTAQSGLVLSPGPAIGLVDGAGNRVATRGVAVTASIASGVGSITGTLEVRTDQAGEARFADLRLAGPVGAKTLRFTTPGLTGVVTSAIDLAAGAPSAIVPAAGNNQTAAAGTALATALAVRIDDGAGNPVPNVGVGFAVSSGGGTIEGGTVATGVDGVARVTRWTLGPTVGSNTATATAGALQLVFTATGTVGPPAKILVAGGDGQAAVIGQLVPVAPSVKVTDAFDNPISGVAVTFAAGSGGSVTGGTAQTDGTGVATVGSWNLGFTPGAQTLTVSRAGVNPPASLTATATHYPVVALSAGGMTTCAVAVGGAGVCWGNNVDGQLGDGTTVDKNVPTAIVSGSTVFGSIATGTGHACGLRPSGEAFCWGNNFSGQLGDGSAPNGQLTPVPVTGGHQFQALVLGDVHTCGLRLDGTAWCWGSNANGRVGDNTTVAQRVTPVAVAGGLTFTALAAGAGHTCGLTAAGLYCWGAGGGGRLGDGSAVDRRAPTLVAAPGITFIAVAAGVGHTCAITDSNTAMCWGGGTSGALGTGNQTNQLTPVAVSGTGSYAKIAAGLNHSCAITTTGAVQCWGSNASGKLGDGTTANRAVPTAIAVTLSAASVDLGYDHSCVATVAGSAVCWGRNAEGQLGDGTLVAAPKPQGVKSP
jgi:alpha-tubulin suppressor-like RCC1 family protein